MCGRLPALLLALGAAAAAAAEEGLGLAGESFWPVLRPPKLVIRTVRALAPELFMSAPETIERAGYPVQEHRVRTEDGYQLTLHRIPRGRAANASASPGPPLLLQHGIFGRSDLWVAAGANSPAMQLADAGYDVWIGNARGNHYSRSHDTLRTGDPEFWDFSWHEMGMFDIPASIDYVLNATGHDRLFYVGHSMGNAVFFVMASSRPEYNSKVRLQVSLAPAVFFDALRSQPLRLVVAQMPYLKAVIDALPTRELPRRSDAFTALYYLICGERSYFNKLCAVFASMVAGDIDLNNTKDLCLHLTRGMSSTSALVPLHYMHVLRSGGFHQMDGGEAQNMREYGSPQPPAYPLERVSTPVAIYFSDGDNLVPSQGVKRLSRTLPNVVTMHRVNETFFNHLDFQMHSNLRTALMDHLLTTMQRF